MNGSLFTKKISKTFTAISASVLLTALGYSSAVYANESKNSAVKLYTFECGTIDVSDMDAFSSTGDYAKTQKRLAGSCFLIRHPKGDLMWDTGLSASLVDSEPLVNGIFTLTQEKTLVAQLAQLKLTPKDIEYLSISHNHFDHTGQMSAFADATWLVSEAEYKSIASEESLKSLYEEVKAIPRKIINGDYDIFGDGRVVILAMPGHTHGHTVLQVNLANTGPVLLSGDLYHQAKSRELKRVPRFNVDEPQTLESIARFEQLAKKLNAKVVIQHEKSDIDKLPKLPHYLD